MTCWRLLRTGLGATLVSGGALAQGRYARYVHCTATGAQLIVNRRTGQWGAAYGPKQDLARLEMGTD